MCNWNQKLNNKTCQCECKNYRTCKKDIWNPSSCTSENNRYLKSIGDTSVMKLCMLWTFYQQQLSRVLCQ